MVLRKGDTGDAVKVLQRGLNKLGSMLLVDGNFGTGTRDAVVDARVTLNRPGLPEADDDLQAAVASFPDPFPPLTAAGMTFIARQEVSSAAAYRQMFQKPTLPPAPSGVTIGIGYDCRFVTPQQFETDWTGVLPPAVIGAFTGVLGKVGTPALLSTVNTIIVPLSAAMAVFARRSLPQFLGETRTIYPEVDTLPAARRTALVSLVYNRGPRLADVDGREDRREMRAIRDLLASHDPQRIDTIADQFELMVRLFDPAKVAGVIQRRRDEAALWRGGFAALTLD